MTRGEQAEHNFREGYTCAQAVALAFCKDAGADEKTLLAATYPMGGGMGRMRLTCGAVNAMAIIAGMKMSHGQPGDLQRRGEIYAVVRQMVEEFKADNGTIICAELLGRALPKNDSPQPEERTADYYKRRPCPEKIRQCGLIIEKYLGIEE